MMVEILRLFLDRWSHPFRLPGKYDSLIILLIIQGVHKITQGHDITEEMHRNKQGTGMTFKCVDECVGSGDP